MAVAVYPALVTGDQIQGYRGELVDFPEVSLHEANSADLLAAARARLLEALSALEKRGGDWPVATPVEALSERVQTAGGVLVLVDVQVEETPVRVNISIGDRLLRRLDDAAEARSMTRSGYIAAAVRQRLGDGGPQGEAMSGFNTQRLFDEVAEVGRRVNEAVGPESAFGRAITELDGRAFQGLRVMAENVTSAVNRRRETRSADQEKS